MEVAMTTDDTIDALRDELQRVRLERAGLLSDIEQLRAELARLRIENEGLRAELAAMPKGKRGTRRRKTEPVTPARDRDRGVISGRGGGRARGSHEENSRALRGAFF
jgi:regulator of replication initiation timing